MNFDREFIKEFINESKEHLEIIEDDLLTLEKQRSKPDKDLIDKIFRAIHTIKGNAGFFHLTNMGNLTHVMETLLSAMRTGAITPTPDLVDVLLEGIDKLKAMLDDIDNCNDLDITTVQKTLEDIITKAMGHQYKQALKKKIRLIDLKGKQTGIEIDEMTLMIIPRNHTFLYLLQYDLTKLLQNKSFSPASLVKRLNSTGNIIKALVMTPFKDLHEGLPDNKFMYSVLYSTVLDPDLISDAVFLPPGQILQVDFKRPEKIDATEELITGEMVEKFISESLDLLDKSEKYILEFEKNRHNIEPISEAFRNIHSLKGNAGFFEYHNLEKQSIEIEEILDNIRQGKTSVKRNSINRMLSLIDSIRMEINSIGGGTDKNKKEGAASYKPLGQILVDMGEITQDTLDKALKIQERKIGEILVDEKILNQEKIDKALQLQGKAASTDQIQYSSYGIKRRDIRVDMNKLDILFDLMGELVTAEAMVISNPDLEGLALNNFNKTAGYLSKITREMQEITMLIRMIPLEGLFNKMRRLVRDLSRKFNKEISLFISGQETEMDRNVIEEISDPLIHIIRNSVDHGIEDKKTRKRKGKDEAGCIRLNAKYEGNEIWITVEDDGAGLDRKKILKKAIDMGLAAGGSNGTLSDHEVWQFILEPGFSTAKKVSEISGRGVGLDVVRKNIEKLRGKIEINSTKDTGTGIILKIPLTLAIIEGVTVKVGNMLYAIPIADIAEFHKAEESQVTKTELNREVIRLRDHVYPVIRLSNFFRTNSNRNGISGGIVIFCQASNSRRVGILVDSIVSYQQIVIKALPEYIGSMKGVSGCSIMGNGDINLILDVGEIVKHEFESAVRVH